MTVGDLKQYFGRVMTTSGDTTVVQCVRNERGEVVERELADSECVALEDASTQHLVFRNSPGAVRATRRTTNPAAAAPPSADDEIPPPPVSPPPPPVDETDEAPRPIGMAQQRQSPPRVVARRPPPALTVPPGGGGGVSPQQTSTATTSTTEEQGQAIGIGAGGREDRRRRLRRKPSRSAILFSEAQPQRIQRTERSASVTEDGLLLVQVEHRSTDAHALWTLAIDPTCTGAALCLSVLEIEAAAQSDAAADGTGNGGSGEGGSTALRVPATLYQVRIETPLPSPTGTAGAAGVPGTCTSRRRHSLRQSFDPRAGGIERVDLDANVYNIVAHWENAKDHYFVVLDDEDGATAQQQHPQQSVTQSGDKKKKPKAPIVVDVDDESGGGGGAHDAEDSYWIRENEIQWLNKISSGTFARVYKGVYDGKVVAVKMLKGKLDEKMISEFRKEFRIFKAVHHPNILECYGVCLEHNKLSYVMEYCARGSLLHVMTDPNLAFAWENVADLFEQAVRGINFLHTGAAHAIIHRDLKSQNLLVTRDYCVKVGDFGLSRFNTVSNGTTLENLCGTMSHCAPEVFTGERFTTKSDIYSLGMVLWELCERVATGTYTAPFKEYPFIVMDIQIIIQASQKHLRPTIHRAVPERFAQLIRRCWDPDPNARPEAIQLLALLESFPKRRLGTPVPAPVPSETSSSETVGDGHPDPPPPPASDSASVSDPPTPLPSS